MRFKAVVYINDQIVAGMVRGELEKFLLAEYIEKLFSINFPNSIFLFGMLDFEHGGIYMCDFLKYLVKQLRICVSNMPVDLDDEYIDVKQQVLKNFVKMFDNVFNFDTCKLELVKLF
jgi:hypothetical protein